MGSARRKCRRSQAAGSAKRPRLSRDRQRGRINRQIGPLFLGAFDFRAVPAAASALRAIEMLRAYYDAGRRTWPASLPTGFIKRSWHDAVMTPQGLDRKAYEMCVFAELRDRLRAGESGWSGAGSSGP